MANISIVAIVQARMGSTRLPGKVLKPVLEKPLLGFLIERLKRSKLLSKIVIATTNKKQDEPIIKLAKDYGVVVFRGSEEDVLDRFAKAAGDADIIVRITADCPLLDPAIVDRAIQIFLENRYDYVSNAIERTYPRGMDVEVFSRRALEIAAQNATSREEREHVTPYLLRHPELFILKNFTAHRNHSDLRWTVDTAEDFELVSRLIEITYPEHPDFTMEDLLLTYSEHPELRFINAHIEQKKL